MIFSFPKFTLDIDVNNTKDYYSTTNFVSEVFFRSGCRNYEKAVDSLPKEVKSFFLSLELN